MSAWLCSDLHTHVLAAWAVKRGLAEDELATATRLRDANNAALFARYGDTPVPLSADFTAPSNVYTDQQINTLARSFAYQCSEGDVMETHPVAPLIEEIIKLTGGDEVKMADGFWSFG